MLLTIYVAPAMTACNPVKLYSATRGHVHYEANQEYTMHTQHVHLENIVHVPPSQLKQLIFDMHSNAKQMHGTLYLNGRVSATLAAC